MTSQADDIVRGARRLLSAGKPVSMAALAKAAGLSRATLYRLVPDRAALEALLAKHDLALPQDDSEQRILQATRVVLERNGFDSATMEDIATEADVSPVTLYRRYGDRDGLIQAFLDAVPARRKARTLTPSADSDVEAELSLLATIVLQELLTARGLIRAALGASEAQRKHLTSIYDGARGTTVALEKYFAACVKLGLIDCSDPRALATVFTSTLMGLALRSDFDGSPPPDPQVMGPFLARTVLKGVRR